MREVIPHRLWLGNAVEARRILPVTELEIQAVIDLAMNEPPVQFPREIVYCRFPLIDGSGNDETTLRAAISAASQFLLGGTKLFVFCSAGMSRSVAIAAAAWALAEQCSLEDALRTVASEGPSDVSPGLWQDVTRVLSAE